MTVVVKKTADDLMTGLGNLYDAMVADYANFMVPDDDNRKKMNDDYANGLAYTFGRKYIKMIGNGSVKAFIVNTDNDKKLHQVYKGLSANVVKTAFNWTDEYMVEEVEYPQGSRAASFPD